MELFFRHLLDQMEFAPCIRSPDGDVDVNRPSPSTDSHIRPKEFVYRLDLEIVSMPSK